VLCSGEDDEIQAQPDRLESVLDNLIDNAIQAMEGRAGGRIEIEIRSNRKTIEVEFRDNGPGFSSDALQMALQPFYSGRPKGTGIGLTLARRIVEDHGGKLTLANRRQGGAVVRLTFKRTA
jgi:signal transduction histidine kinase